VPDGPSGAAGVDQPQSDRPATIASAIPAVSRSVTSLEGRPDGTLLLQHHRRSDAREGEFGQGRCWFVHRSDRQVCCDTLGPLGAFMGDRRPGWILEDRIEAEFTAFMEESVPRLRRALIAAVGVEAASESLAEGLAYAWQHWERIRNMQNRAGYVYRVARNDARRQRRPVVFPPVPSDELPHVEPSLNEALALLSQRQRVVVVLVHGLGWTQREVAELLGLKISSVRNHLRRGLDQLRKQLKVTAHE
jgi:RNA polymerase sigma factor (sigma-70 family)